MNNDELLIVIPYSASDEGGESSVSDMGALDNLLSQMDDGSADTQDTQTQSDEGTPNTEPDSEPKNQNDQQQAQSKQNFAFGQMRTQINQLTALLGKVAKANGVEYTDSKDLVSKLNDDTINKMAQKQNVPVELLREIESLRQDSEAYKQQRLKDAAAVGFQSLMDTYGLTQEQLQQFAVELDQDGKNPFMQPIDLMAEYKVKHFDDIVNARVKQAVEEALKKDSAANQSSTVPDSKQGGGSGSDQKITTVAGLSALLDGMK